MAVTDGRSSELVLRWARLVAAEGFDRGLQPAQWQALRYLASANRFSRTPKGLTAWLGQTKGSVSQTIIALEGKGLLTRQPDPDDRRVVRLELTPAGRELLDAPPPAMAQRMLASLPPADREQFNVLAERMLRAEILRSGGRPFGLCRDCKHFVPSSQQYGEHRCGLLGVALSDEDSSHICFEQEPA